jgi:flagellar P-ring protein precursor FlgI
MPAFSRVGAKIDVKVSSIGSAKSLRGGVLLETHLTPVGSIDSVYAVAQGPLLISEEDTVTTVAEMPGGALMVDEEPTDVVKERDGIRYISLLLNNPDYTTANNIVDAVINDTQLFGEDAIARAVNAGQIDVLIPRGIDEVSFISTLLNVTVEVDNSARVVINQRTRTVIIGEYVTVLPVAISHGELRITVGMEEQNVATLEARGSGGTPLQKIVDMLNAVKATPDDIIAIIQALKAAGALQGELILR